MPADSDASSLYTLSESVRQVLYRHQGERRLQAVNEDYYWPCDSAAVKLELSIAAVGERLYKNGLYWEPEEGDLEKVLCSTGSILDLGSGSTSTWAISMAERFPAATVIGVDLVPTDLSYLPGNLSIEVHDLLEGLPYPDASFDLVHARAIAAASFFDSTCSILPDIQRILRPGGVLLLEEYEDTHRPFSSRTSSNPHLDLVDARQRLRMDLIADSNPDAIPRLRWGSRMADEVRQTKEFRNEHGGKVDGARIEVPVGRSSGTDDTERQTGYLNEKLWAALWEMHSVGLGSSEKIIEQSRRVDETVLENAVGVFNILRVVWAVKGNQIDDDA